MYKKGNWTVKDSKTLFKNPWIEVIKDSVVKPDGVDGAYTWIKILPGAAAIAVDNDQNVYLARNYLYAIDREVITCFGGGKDEGEDWLDTAKRELKEEAGLLAHKWTSLGELEDSISSIVNSPAHIFLAEDLEEMGQKLDNTESLNIFKIPLTQAVDWVIQGKIVQPATIIMILRAHLYLNKR